MGACQSCPGNTAVEEQAVVSDRAASGTLLAPHSNSESAELAVKANVMQEPSGAPAGREAWDLQEWFEVLPPPGKAGWLGGDSDVSLVIGGPKGPRVLWIFADTFITKYKRDPPSRVYKGFRMPRNTIAIADRTECGRRWGQPRFIWRCNSGGLAVDFFDPTPEQQAAGELLWPVAGIASRDGRSVLLLAQRVKGFLNVVGTTAIVIRDVASIEDPREWQYTLCDVDTADLTWFSSIFFAGPEGDTVYILGHQTAPDGTPASPDSGTVLSRASLPDLLDHNWGNREFWTAPGTWSQAPSNLQAIGLKSWETTVVWSDELGLWYSFFIEPLGAAIFMYTAEEVTGEWRRAKVYDIPAPFTSSPWINYAAKAHPELQHHCHKGAEAGAEEVELVLTFISNALEGSDNQSTGGTLFEVGGMEWCHRGYWPRFVRVAAGRRR